MAGNLEKACLGCSLPICDDRDARCKFTQITRSTRRNRDRRARRQARETEQMKEDIIQILGRLIGQKAVDEARQ